MDTTNNSCDTHKPAKTPKCLEGIRMQKIEGVNYLTFALGQDLAQFFKLVRGVPIRSDDVITIGFPRSGNHWTFEVVSMILSQTTEFQKDHFYSRILEYLGGNVVSTVENIPSPRNLTSHCRMQNIPEQAVEKKVKLIYILRNPKDVLVSLYKFVLSLSDEGSTFRGSWADFFDTQMQGEFPWGYWFDHVLATETFQKKHPDCPVFVLVYEKLKANPVAEIEKLCAFLDKPCSIAGQIAEITQFSHMKSELAKTKMSIQSGNHFRNGPDDILRKGIVGDWRNWFTVAQNEAFDKLFETKMVGSKLGDMMREYIK